MAFSEKLVALRRRDGLSQEQLADRLGVTRQSVSKWESGAAMPELGKLIAVSELFDVTIDYLVKDKVPQSTSSETARLEQRVKELEKEYRGSFGPYFEYTSKAHFFGVPLLSVRFGRDRHPTKHTTAVGMIAVGNFAVGAVSIGLISLGLISLGMLAFGGLSLGMVSMGGVAAGVSAIGVHARGISALNITT